MNKKIEQIYSELISHYQTNLNNIGYLAFGSAARGQEDENSDIDFYIITKKKPQHYRENFIYKGQRIDILFDSVLELEKYLENEKNNLRRPVANMIYNSKLVLAKTGAVIMLMKKSKIVLQSKIKYSKSEVLMHKYSLDDFLGEAIRDYKTKNIFAFTLDAQLIIDNSVELFCKLNNITLTQPREMLNKIFKKDKKFAGLIREYSAIINSRNRLNSLKKIVKYIYSISNGALPNKWSV
ncbi:MAG: hypothetical protein COX77_01905 [Candidatus Komeilibacteria bacterium CG_4_10_14_0_2_um_filter_37_10]|uniref:Polymerase beta nucleotidyltransferase domain-containing protein n=1 Tax=Candidatus Komeilibacteria bacterium CG_4_10_14_0_2_um_filter_37_10 TaxID=1974470 RepID=A0A2M7VFI7_9BACT|nr:MAG: hypothetical protein COX77_01905 [Candidatus Komeilibacteria bacterium CG_4_10_14_0_2_um_filter_37_10]PJA94301.1 MAG: hypothetical protein CO133_00160 [Candidatus Komeilibacteria bacterium CG_4_9_14_3_um_filter_37_5]